MLSELNAEYERRKMPDKILESMVLISKEMPAYSLNDLWNMDYFEYILINSALNKIYKEQQNEMRLSKNKHKTLR